MFCFCKAQLERIADALESIEALLRRLLRSPSDLQLLKGESTVPKVFQLKKGKKIGQAMSQVNLTDLVAAGGGIRFQPVDDQTPPQPVPTTAANVSTTLSCDNASVTTPPGVDSLHYGISIPPAVASSGQVITLTGVITYLDGSFGPFNSTLPILCNLPAPPPKPVDLQLVVG